MSCIGTVECMMLKLAGMACLVAAPNNNDKYSLHNE